MTLSNPKCVDWYDLSNEATFVLFDQMNTITKPLACGVSVLGISKSYMINFWYKLVDNFSPYNIHLIFTDTDSLFFQLVGENYKAAYIFSYIREEPLFAEWFDLSDVTDDPDKPPIDNPCWSMKNKGVMKFEVLGIGDICAVCPKMNSILTFSNENGEEHIKIKLTGKELTTAVLMMMPRR